LRLVPQLSSAAALPLTTPLNAPHNCGPKSSSTTSTCWADCSPSPTRSSSTGPSKPRSSLGKAPRGSRSAPPQRWMR